MPLDTTTPDLLVRYEQVSHIGVKTIVVSRWLPKVTWLMRLDAMPRGVGHAAELLEVVEAFTCPLSFDPDFCVSQPDPECHLGSVVARFHEQLFKRHVFHR